LVFWGVSASALTERRKQFLEKLLDLYRRTHLPVHYETVARAIGVSKWTAYDMLTQLERLGYLRREYAVHRGEAGRSVVVFTPTPAAEGLFPRAQGSAAAPVEWEAVKAQVSELLHRFRGLHPGEATRRLLEHLAGLKSRLAFCTQLLGLLVFCLRDLEDRAVQQVRQLVRSAPGAEMRLTVFVGAAAGSLAQGLGQSLSRDLAEVVGRFLGYLRDLDPGEQEMLDRLLETALGELA